MSRPDVLQAERLAATIWACDRRPTVPIGFSYDDPRPGTDNGTHGPFTPEFLLRAGHWDASSPGGETDRQTTAGSDSDDLWRVEPE